MIEAAFEMMHAGFEKTFAVQTTPKADGAERFPRGQLYARKIDLGFFRGKVDIGENNDALDRLLENLRAPPRFRASVVTFPTLEAELFERFDQIDKELSRRAEGVMIVVRPSEAQRILTALLFLPGAIPFLPIGALFPEK